MFWYSNIILFRPFIRSWKRNKIMNYDVESSLIKGFLAGDYY